MSEWISVEEKLPYLVDDKESEIVLVYDSKLGIYPATCMKSVNSYVWFEKNSYNNNMYKLLSPSHWMPLPEPPKE